jgi:hypothetical protein
MSISLNDVHNIEEGVENEQDYFDSIQRAINGGSAWRFQGSYGRAMMDAIESGRCMLGREDTRDYYGNHIPSRSQVKAGTKGSRKYVANAMGERYARRMTNLK